MIVGWQVGETMINFDSKNKQILTSACLKCIDPYFAPAQQNMIHAGCCSYSPVFGLFEIYQMVKDGKENYFMERIYQNKEATVFPFEIVIHADVNPLFHKQKVDHLTPIEKADLRLQYSVCQFFKPKKGCDLPASYKNATCRSFICLPVEENLDHRTQTQLKEWNAIIRKEVHTFVELHRNVLQLRGLNLLNNVTAVIEYLQSEVNECD